MPTIHRIGSIKIVLYSRDHLPPHFHIKCGGDEAILSIRTLKLLKGSIPKPLLNKVCIWAKNESVKNNLLVNFFRLNPRFIK